MAIELDGDSHFQKGFLARREARQAAIESFGIHFLGFRNVEVFEHLGVVLATHRETPAGTQTQQRPP